MILCMYIAPGQGLTTPWGRNFDVNRNILSLRSFLASFKKISLKSDFIYIFFFMIIAPGQGQTALRGQSFDVNSNVLSLHSFVESLKKNLWSLILYNFFFHDLIHVYSPGARADRPRGQNFDVYRKALSPYWFVASFKEISLNSDFFFFFFFFFTI